MTSTVACNVSDLIHHCEHFSAATLMNDRSSRAHTMVQIKVTQARADTDAIVSSELALVDLAGSEQLKQSHAEGQQKKEATAINSSLMVLRKCISALIEGKAHVPFYESKLTMLLRPAFSGNSRTTAIITAAPEPSNGEQTLSSLRFGEECSQISTNALCSGVKSVSDALNTIDLALRRCEADINSLDERGHSGLPAFHKLTEKFTRLGAKRQQLLQIKADIDEKKVAATARTRRKDALKGIQAVSDRDNARAEKSLASSREGGGMFIPF